MDVLAYNQIERQAEKAQESIEAKLDLPTKRSG